MLKIAPIFLAVTLLISCTRTDKIDTGEPFSGSAWVGSTQEMPSSDADFYADHPAPQFVKSFVVKRIPDDARMMIAAAGYYTLWINGQRISDAYLSPAWTDYSKRIYYREYPVNEYLTRGENVIAVELGNGWYNPLPLRMWGHANLRERIPVGQPRFIADLQLSRNGAVIHQIVTDSTWLWSPGEITRNSVYLGEWHDMRQETEQWQLNADHPDLLPVQVLDSPGGRLQLADFPPIRKTTSVQAVDLWITPQQTCIVDFGQNMAGWFKYSGPMVAGDSIFFRSGERIWPDSTLNTLTAVTGQIKRKGVGGPGAPPIAEQFSVFIPGSETDFFEPRYSFQGFRYVEISGLPLNQLEAIDTDHLTAWRVGTDVGKIGRIEAEHAWIEEIQDLTEWTLLSNIFSVISDCPAREKFGYGGDINATAETWLYNFEVRQIFEKIIRDWHDAMNDDGFVDTAPFVGIQYCGIAWESAYLFLQDYLFTFYGDLPFVSQWYEENLQWIQKAQTLHGNDLVRQGLADHESLLPVPVELVGSLHYYRALRVMQKFSALLEKHTHEIQFKEIADSYQLMLIDSLWNNPVIAIKNPQTWLSGLLYFDVLPAGEHAEAMQRLVADLDNRQLALTTGIYGTKWMLEVLAKNGQVQLAYDLVARRDFPGWRYMMDHGATTFWETWKESDNVFSQNHPMFSSVSTFLHKWIGGIDPVDGGFERIMLHPAPVRGLGSFSASRTLDEQEIKVSWTRTDASVVFELHIPEKTEVVWIPQIVRPEQLETIQGPDGQQSTAAQPQILFNDPGIFTLTYRIGTN